MCVLCYLVLQKMPTHVNPPGGRYAGLASRDYRWSRSLYRDTAVADWKIAGRVVRRSPSVVRP